VARIKNGACRATREAESNQAQFECRLRAATFQYAGAERWQSDADRFRPKLGRSRARDAVATRSFIARVLRATKQADTSGWRRVGAKSGQRRSSTGHCRGEHLVSRCEDSGGGSGRQSGRKPESGPRERCLRAGEGFTEAHPSHPFSSKSSLRKILSPSRPECRSLTLTPRSTPDFLPHVCAAISAYAVLMQRHA
jgi:hypothetical protein